MIVYEIGDLVPHHRIHSVYISSLLEVELPAFDRQVVIHDTLRELVVASTLRTKSSLPFFVLFAWDKGQSNIR